MDRPPGPPSGAKRNMLCIFYCSFLEAAPFCPPKVSKGEDAFRAKEAKGLVF
jgi:hypothetical protein